MQIAGSKGKYIELLARQLLTMTSIDYSQSEIIVFLERYIDSALKRAEYCLSKSKIGAIVRNGGVVYNPLHSGHSSIFLYYLSQEARQEGGTWSQMVAYLNKMLNGLECSPFVELPEYFFLEHPLGTILGRAKYRNGFFCLQGCTVGAANSRRPLVFPEFGENVLMMGHSTVLGGAHIGNNVILSFGSMIMGDDVPDNSIVFGRSPQVEIVTIGEERMKEKIADFWVIDRE